MFRVGVVNKRRAVRRFYGNIFKKSQKMASSLTAARLSSAEPTDDNIESKLKYLIKDRCLRISEYFKDYDPLRSGYITSQYIKSVVSIFHIML